MRYREKQLRKMYPNENKISCKYIVWLDIYAFFPYDYESLEVAITVYGNNIVQGNEKKDLIRYNKKQIEVSTPFPNKQWMAISTMDNKKSVGIPLVFDSFEELSHIEGITYTWVFSYKNEKGEHNKLAIQCTQNFSFLYSEVQKDYVIEKQCTSIPSILENQSNVKRRNIIDSYSEVIHAKAELGVTRRKDIPIYTSRIKSENNTSDEESLKVTNKVLDYLISEGLIDNCENIFMCIFYDKCIEMIQPSTAETQVYLLGNSK